MILGKVIVMDDVSRLADKSDEFAQFLTVSHKYRLTCAHFSYDISEKTKLANHNVTNKNI